MDYCIKFCCRLSMMHDNEVTMCLYGSNWISAKIIIGSAQAVWSRFLQQHHWRKQAGSKVSCSFQWRSKPSSGSPSGPTGKYLTYNLVVSKAAMCGVQMPPTPWACNHCHCQVSVVSGNGAGMLPGPPSPSLLHCLLLLLGSCPPEACLCCSSVLSCPSDGTPPWV